MIHEFENIEEVKNTITCIQLFNEERIGFTYEMNKNAIALKKALKEHNAETKSLMESFFEEAVPAKSKKPSTEKNKTDIVEENKKAYKQYVFVMRGKQLVPKRDADNALIEFKEGVKLPAGETVGHCVPDDRKNEFMEALQKLTSAPVKVEIHQVLQHELNEKIQLREEKKGDSINANITELLTGVIFVDAIE